MVVHAYYPLGETRVQREAAALVDRGWEVDVVCLRWRGEVSRETVDGVTVHRLPVRRHRGTGMLAQMFEYLAFFVLAGFTLTRLHISKRFHTVQVHNLPDFLVFSALVPKAMGARIVLDLHDLMPELYTAKTGAGLNGPLARVLRLQERIAARFADHVITVTAGWRDTLIGRGVHPNKVSVVMNLADPKVFPPRRFNSKDAEGLTLVYHGTFASRYGVDVIVRALSELRDEVPRARLMLLGDGETRQELVELIGVLGIEDRVELSKGMVDTTELPDLLASADVGVVPNRSNVFTEEILPTKLLEYVAMGIPVIAARTHTVSKYFDEEMVEFFRPGDVDDLADRIRGLDKDRDRLKDLSRNAAAFNRVYDWASAASDYADLMESMADRERS